MIDHDNKICFIHIPKNAGQSVERWFFDLRGLDPHDPAHRRELHLFKNDFDTGLPRAADHFAYAHYRDVVFGGAIPEDYRLFSIVRDPLARLQSELNYRFGGRIPPRLLLAMRRIPMRRMFDDFRTHLDTQMSFLSGAPAGRIRILRLENLEQDFIDLTEDLGLPTRPLPRVNSHSGRRRPLPSPIVDWAVETYEVDFTELGYAPPRVASRHVNRSAA